jgi:hypothetical protein
LFRSRSVGDRIAAAPLMTVPDCCSWLPSGLVVTAVAKAPIAGELRGATAREIDCQLRPNRTDPVNALPEQAIDPRGFLPGAARVHRVGAAFERWPKDRAVIYGLPLWAGAGARRQYLHLGLGNNP